MYRINAEGQVLVRGEKLQEVAAAAGEKLARQLIENEIQLRREAGENF
jgi:hypothetical protein